MADTIRTRAELLDIFVTNNKGRITAQNMRDFIASIRLLAESEYVHTQTVPSSHWDIHHNLGGTPSITVYTSRGDEVTEVIGGITWVDDNYATLDVNVTSPITGKAICRL